MFASSTYLRKSLFCPQTQKPLFIARKRLRTLQFVFATMLYSIAENAHWHKSFSGLPMPITRLCLSDPLRRLRFTIGTKAGFVGADRANPHFHRRLWLRIGLKYRCRRPRSKPSSFPAKPRHHCLSALAARGRSRSRAWRRLIPAWFSESLRDFHRLGITRPVSSLR